MVRWSYLLPRLLIMVACLLFLQFGLDPLLRWSLIEAGQAATGAKVDVGDLQANVVKGNLYVARVGLADPSSPLKNLVEFDNAWFKMDSQALLRRRFVVREARVSGLRIDATRTASGKLEVEPEEPSDDGSDEMKRQAAELADKWFADFTQRLQGDLTKDFESVRLSQELMQRWPQEYAQLKQRADEWKVRVQNLRELYNSVRENPLRELPNLEKHVAQLEQIRKEIPQLRDEFERLQKQALQDRQAIDSARQHDVATIKEKLNLKNLDPNSLSQYLIGPQFTQYLEQFSSWVQQARELYGVVQEHPELNQSKGRGVTVSFDAGPRQPTLLIQMLGLDGQARLGDEEVAFVGRLRNLTPQPKLLGQPAQFQFQCRGKADFQVEATLDRTGLTPKEHLVINIPKLAQPQRVLGKEDRLALRLAPGAAHVWLQVDFVAEQMNGQIIWKQEDTHLSPVIDEQRTGARLAEHMRAVAGEVHSFHAAIQLTGTVRRPHLQLQSNLGPQLAQGINGAVQRELEFRQEQLTKLAQDNVDKALAQVDRLIQEKQHELASLLQLGDQQMEQLKQQLLAQVNVPGILQQKGLAQVEGLLKGRGLLPGTGLLPSATSSQLPPAAQGTPFSPGGTASPGFHLPPAQDVLQATGFSIENRLRR